MRSLLQRHPVAFALAAIAIFLAAVVAIEAAVGLGRWKTQSGSSSKTAALADTKLTPPMSTTLAEHAYPETANRPLFTPTRRPAPAAPVAGGAMAKGTLTLQGVIGVGGLHVALLRDKNGKMHRVEKGKEVNGMTLSAVERDRVTLTQGGDSEVLSLVVQKGPTVAAAAPAAPGAPGAAPVPAAAAAGPFGPAPGAAPAAGAPGGQPSAPGAIGTPAAAGVPPQPPPAAANPATRSGFGPFNPQAAPQTPAAATGDQQAVPMTPEELLARRRARRAQQQGQQPQK